MRCRMLLASMTAAAVLSGCSASTEESSSHPKADMATSSASTSPTDTSSSSASPEVSVSEIPTESVEPTRPQGWVGPEDGFTLTADVTDKKSAEAAGAAALAFLKKWTLREDLMRADRPTARAALSAVTPELSPNAAAAWKQNLAGAANLNNTDAWGSLQALVRVAATGPEWNLPASVPLVSNRTFVDDVFITTDQYTGGYRVGIDYTADLTSFADPAKPKAGLVRASQESSLSLVMSQGPSGWQVFSWTGQYKSGDPVHLQ